VGQKTNGRRTVGFRLDGWGDRRGSKRALTLPTRRMVTDVRARVHAPARTAQTLRCVGSVRALQIGTLGPAFIVDCAVLLDLALDAAAAAAHADERVARGVCRDLRDLERAWLGSNRTPRSRAATPFSAARIDLENHLRKRAMGRADCPKYLKRSRLKAPPAHGRPKSLPSSKALGSFPGPPPSSRYARVRVKPSCRAF